MSLLRKVRLSQTNRPLDVLLYWDTDGGMLLSPPYQRGDVWGLVRQRNLIKSLLMGIPIPSIVINDRMSAGWDDRISCAVVDGKQRITAILRFLHNGLDVPGEWFGLDVPMVSMLDLSERHQRLVRNIAIPFTEGQLSSLELEEELFELVNYGGVPQGESDLPVIQGDELTVTVEVLFEYDFSEAINGINEERILEGEPPMSEDDIRTYVREDLNSLSFRETCGELPLNINITNAQQ